MQNCVNACEHQMSVHVNVRSGYCTYKRAIMYLIVRAIQKAATRFIVQVLVISSNCALTNACLYAYMHRSVCLEIYECWRA
jgi:hypothetical protein